MAPVANSHRFGFWGSEKLLKDIRHGLLSPGELSIALSHFKTNISYEKTRTSPCRFPPPRPHTFCTGTHRYREGHSQGRRHHHPRRHCRSERHDGGNHHE